MAGINSVDKWTRAFHDMATGKAPTTQDFYVVETNTKPFNLQDSDVAIATGASQTVARAKARIARKKSVTKKFINRGRKRSYVSRRKKKTGVKKKAATRRPPVKPRKKSRLNLEKNLTLKK